MGRSNGNGCGEGISVGVAIDRDDISVMWCLIKGRDATSLSAKDPLPLLSLMAYRHGSRGYDDRSRDYRSEREPHWWSGRGSQWLRLGKDIQLERFQGVRAPHFPPIAHTLLQLNSPAATLGA